MTITIKTTMGDVTVMLYDETPLHRDNFLKLTADGTYRDTLFHRVIRDFMVQAGDPESKGAPRGKMLGSGDVGYTVPAEFDVPRHYHRRGALAAARLGDEANPRRESSGCQFYIVVGRKYSEKELRKLERQINESRVEAIFNDEAGKHYDEIKRLRLARDREGLQALLARIEAKAREEVAGQGAFAFTDEQVRDYVEVGGTPFLDGQYTVFGEVTDGMDVIEAIQGVVTDRNDRPVEDIRIIDVVAND